MIALPKRARPATNADINIVPYIDVMLVLLVIFMMTTPIIEQGIEVDLPQAPATMVEYEDQQPTVIGINKDGLYNINSMMDPGIEETNDMEPVSLSVIINQVIARHQIWPEMQVFVKGDNDAEYGMVIDLIAGLKYQGIDKIGFMTENPN